MVVIANQEAARIISGHQCGTHLVRMVNMAYSRIIEIIETCNIFYKCSALPEAVWSPNCI